ncbi:hypothetical protein GIS00_23325 [Nakamurella sp. YIM 132087]|uniref:Transcriptional regulator n=1 Tax=Nakamurella alba TaxID=2665158 RepID=A0A7K1FS22_9ACTN|nr:hypothetical protein [Nakamurella alba]MTD16870.1 hypothetical protein [Nakamurella alba]
MTHLISAGRAAIAAGTGTVISDLTANRDLTKLTVLGYLQSVGRTRGTYYTAGGIITEIVGRLRARTT